MSEVASRLQERRLELVREHMESENEHMVRRDPRGRLITRATRSSRRARSTMAPSEVQGYYRATRAAFPDQRNERGRAPPCRGRGDRRVRAVGTMRGALRGISADRPGFRCRLCALFLFEPAATGMVCERVYFDQATIALKQVLGGE